LQTREVIGAILVSLAFLIAFVIWRRISWRRAAQETALDNPLSFRDGEVLFSALYVSTVFADSPLERVWAFGLGNRGKCEVFASDEALSLRRVGEADFSIPRDQIHKLTRGSATIDKGVEPRGLLQIHWSLGQRDLITNLRITVDQEKRIRILGEKLGVRSE
jgi:hypothetical protein